MQVCHASVDDERLEVWSKGNVHWQGCWKSEKEGPRVMQIISSFVSGTVVVHCCTRCCEAAKRSSIPLRDNHVAIAADDTGFDLVSSSAAVYQFEKLLAEFGGPLERQRWQDLQSRLRVIPPPMGIDAPESQSNDIQFHEQERGGPTISEQERGGPTISEQERGGPTISEQERGGPTISVSEALSPLSAMQSIPLTTDRVQTLEKITELQKAVFGLGDALQAVTLTANGGAVRSAERQGCHLEVLAHRAAWLTGL